MGECIVSYHPALAADENLLLVSQRDLGAEDFAALAKASAVFLPQVCRPDLYCLVAGLGLPHFPRAGVQLSLDGKLGNHQLFSALGLPQPPALAFPDLARAAAAWEAGEVEAAGLRPPLVAKGAGGGEGRNVFLVGSPGGLAALTGELETGCPHGPDGLLLQQYIECGGRDARVILMGSWRDAFWRQGRPDGFMANLSQGGRVIRDERADELARATDLVQQLQMAAGLDLAAVDLLAPEGGEPLLLEINFYFGRRALGGSEVFLQRLLAAAREWLTGLGLDPGRVRLED